jgi:hypothetical protein
LAGASLKSKSCTTRPGLVPKNQMKMSFLTNLKKTRV